MGSGFQRGVAVGRFASRVASQGRGKAKFRFESMKFLIDKSPKDVERKMRLHPSLVAGQLLTPLTRYRNFGGVFAIDNGAFSGFRAPEFKALLQREDENRDRCLFVTVPDIVASGRRTLEIWKHRHSLAVGLGCARWHGGFGHSLA